MSYLVRTGAAFIRPFLRLWRLIWLRAWSVGDIPVSTQFDGPVRLMQRIRLHLQPHCRLGREVFFDTCGDGRITLGRHVRINAGCTLVSYAAITIGNDCLIGEYVSIRDANHGTAPGSPMRGQPHTFAPIHIGNNVWIGRGSALLKGVTVGDNAVVAANSVVTRDVPPNTLVGGVPAKFIKSLV